MSETQALAAGQGGTVSILAPQSQDEAHRLSAAHELAGHLALGGALIARCSALSKAARGDRLGPLYAAARLMNANAQVARALAHVALVERRTRTIVETIQPLPAKKADLNSDYSSVEEEDEARAELGRRIDAIIKAKEREQEEFDGLAIGCCI